MLLINAVKHNQNLYALLIYFMHLFLQPIIKITGFCSGLGSIYIYIYYMNPVSANEHMSVSPSVPIHSTTSAVWQHAAPYVIAPRLNCVIVTRFRLSAQTIEINAN